MNEESIQTYCYYHPDIETSLRCNQCEKPICARDAVLTDTGYKCKECVRNRQKVFDSAEWFDYIIIALVAGGLAFLGSLLISILPWGFLSIFISPTVGIGIAEAARRAVNRRRSIRLTQTAIIAALLGSLPLLLGALLPLLFGAGLNLWDIIWQVFYTFTVTSTVAYRLGGIRIR